MANVMKNRLNTMMSKEQVELIKNSLKVAIQQLPYAGTVTLDDEDRYSLASLDVDNKAFVEDAIAEVQSRGAGIVPVFISADMMKLDLGLFEQLDEIEGDLMDVLRRVTDMKRIVASEGYGMATVAYGIFGSAADGGIPGAQAAYDKMKKRYKNNGGGAPKVTNE